MALKPPPADLPSRKLSLVSVPNTVFRICRPGHPDPFFWSRLGLHRFDTPEGCYGILYCAEDLETALLEVFGDSWLKTRVLPVSELRLYEFLAFEVNADLRVTDLTGRNLSRLGTDSSLFASTEYLLTQEWSKQLMSHPQAKDGLRYHSRKNPKKFDYALYDSIEAKNGLRVRLREPLIGAAGVPAILDKYEVSLVGR
jgi:hypothetical protein